MQNTKPFVAAELLCENVINEGGIATLVRIVDTFTLDLPKGLPADVTPIVELQLFVSLKSGDVTGNSEVSIVLHRPTKIEEPKKWPIALQGGIHGANLMMKVQLQK